MVHVLTSGDGTSRSRCRDREGAGPVVRVRGRVERHRFRRRAKADHRRRRQRVWLANHHVAEVGLARVRFGQALDLDVQPSERHELHFFIREHAQTSEKQQHGIEVMEYRW